MHQTFIIEVVQPGYMESPKDGALRVTVEGSESEAYQLLKSVLKWTTAINQSTALATDIGEEIEREYQEALRKVEAEDSTAIADGLHIGSWVHRMYEQRPAYLLTADGGATEVTIDHCDEDAHAVAAAYELLESRPSLDGPVSVFRMNELVAFATVERGVRRTLSV